MMYEAIIDELKQIEKELVELQSKRYSEGRQRYRDLSDTIMMIVRRVYPNPSQITYKMYKGFAERNDVTDEKKQENYLYDLDLLLRGVRTILKEFTLFGFDDFKPVKEKIETEFQVGSDKFGFFRKKKSK